MASKVSPFVLAILLFSLLAGALPAEVPSSSRPRDSTDIAAPSTATTPLLRTAALGPIDLARTFPSGDSSAIAGEAMIIQFREPIRQETRDALEQVSEILWYFPDNAFVVRPFGQFSLAGLELPSLHWTGPVPPILKLSPELDLNVVKTQVAVLLHPGSEIPGLLKEKGRQSGPSSYVSGLSQAEIGRLARDESVFWIEPTTSIVTAADNATRFTHVRQTDNGTWSANGQSFWSWTGSALDGFTGTNLTVAVSESKGLDCNHADWKHRLVGAKNYADPDLAGNVENPCNYYGPQVEPPSRPKAEREHATQVVGAAIGNATNDTARRFIGAAPEAKVFFQQQAGSNMPDACADAWDAGARITTQSWINGTNATGAYTIETFNVDRCIIDANLTLAGVQPMITFNAAGNTHTGPQISPANAKNIITIGNSGNEKLNGNVWVRRDDMSGLSTRGPTLDGRIKPELVAPGELVNLPTPASTSYNLTSGTSMSTPFAAGAAGLVYQYYNETRNTNLTPSAMKALLSATTDLMCAKYGLIVESSLEHPCSSRRLSNVLNDVGTQGIYVSGWGLLNASAATFPNDTRRLFIENEYAQAITGSAREYAINVTAGVPLRIMVAWADPPKAPPTTEPLVNDLDAELILDSSNTSRQWRPNQFLNDSYESKSVADGAVPDHKNNIEGFYLANPQGGIYTLKVVGNSVPDGPQKLSVVISGNVNVTARQTILFSDDFATCSVGSDIDGQNEWHGSALNLDVDAAICDIGDWPNAPMTKHLSLQSTSALLSGKFGYARHDYVEPVGKNIASVAMFASCSSTFGSSFFSLLQLNSSSSVPLKIGLSNNNYKLDVTNGSGTAQDVYDIGCGSSNPRYIEAILDSPAASTYTLRVRDFSGGAVLFSQSYSTAAQSAPSKLYMGAASSPNDNGRAIIRSVFLGDQIG